jgi:hypothetical protein
MAKTLSLSGRAVANLAVMAVWLLAVSIGGIAAGSQDSMSPQFFVADNTPASLAGHQSNAPVQKCQRVCVKAGHGTPTHEAPCLQWKIVC